MHKCLAYTPYYIQHSENSEYEPGQKLKKIGLAIGFTKISILRFISGMAERTILNSYVGVYLYHVYFILFYFLCT